MSRRGIGARAAASLVAGVIAAASALIPHQPTAVAAEVARMEVRRAGPYVLDIALDTASPHVQRPVRITVRALPGALSLDNASLTVVGRPGPATDATSTRVHHLRIDARDPGSYAGEMSFAVSGAWLLDVRVAGPAGIGTAEVPITVAAPPAIPPWAGWMIGLSPLAGVAWFAWWNLGYLRRLRAEGL